MNATKGQGAITQLVPGLYTDFLPAGLQDRERDFFGYNVNALNIGPVGAGGAGPTATPTFAVQGDSFFLLTGISGTARDPAAPTVRFAAPAITLQINDGGSGRNLFNQEVHWDTMVGDAQLPAFLPYPKLIKPASTVSWTFTNLDAAQLYDLRVVALGFKIFPSLKHGQAIAEYVGG